MVSLQVNDSVMERLKIDQTFNGTDRRVPQKAHAKAQRQPWTSVTHFCGGGLGVAVTITRRTQRLARLSDRGGADRESPTFSDM
jgi:hypothetical protein